VPASPSGKGEACIGDLFNFGLKNVGAAVVIQNPTQLYMFVRTSQETHYVSTTCATS
jgi:hypothetical protein